MGGGLRTDSNGPSTNCYLMLLLVEIFDEGADEEHLSEEVWIIRRGCCDEDVAVRGIRRGAEMMYDIGRLRRNGCRHQRHQPLRFCSSITT